MNSVEHRRPTLAFAHANGFPGGSYRHFLAPLRDSFDVEVVDRLGHDPRFPVDAHWSSLVEEMEAFLDPLPKPLVGMGHSMGSVLMFMVASRRPDWFRALVMLDPPLINGPMRPLFNFMRAAGLADRITPAGQSRGRVDRWSDQASVQAYFSGRSLFRRFDSRCLQDYIEAGVEACGAGWCLRFRVDVEVDIFRHTPGNLHRFPRLAVPSALITGQDSPPVFHRNHRRHARRHHMTWAMAPGGHMFPLEHPERGMAVVQAVLDTLLAEEATDYAAN